MARQLVYWVGDSGPFYFMQESNELPFRYATGRELISAGSRAVSRGAGSEGRTGTPADQKRVDQAFAGVSVDLFTAYHNIHDAWRFQDLDNSQKADLGLTPEEISPSAITGAASGTTHGIVTWNGSNLIANYWKILPSGLTMSAPSDAQIDMESNITSGPFGTDFIFKSHGLVLQENGLAYYKQGVDYGVALALNAAAVSPSLVVAGSTVNPGAGAPIQFHAYNQLQLAAEIYVDDGAGLSGITDTFIIDTKLNDLLIRSNGTTGNVTLTFPNFLNLQGDDGISLTSVGGITAEADTIINGYLDVRTGSSPGIRLRATGNTSIALMQFYPVAASDTVVGAKIGYTTSLNPDFLILNQRPSGNLTLLTSGAGADTVIQSLLGNVEIKGGIGGAVYIYPETIAATSNIVFEATQNRFKTKVKIEGNLAVSGSSSKIELRNTGSGISTVLSTIEFQNTAGSYADDDVARITATQQTSDSDVIGFDFWVRDSATFADPAIRSVRFRYTGDVELAYNLDVTGSITGATVTAVSAIVDQLKFDEPNPRGHRGANMTRDLLPVDHTHWKVVADATTTGSSLYPRSGTAADPDEDVWFSYDTGCTGTSSANEVVMEPGPFGYEMPCWRTVTGVPPATNRGGGTYTPAVKVDDERSYKVGFFVKPTNFLTPRTSGMYLGLQTVTGESSVVNNFNGAVAANPYFVSAYDDWTTADVWYCILGTLHSKNHNDANKEDLDGVWRVDTVERVSTVNNTFRFAPANNNTKMRVRFFDLNNDSNEEMERYWVKPFFFEMDGTELDITQIFQQALKRGWNETIYGDWTFQEPLTIAANSLYVGGATLTPALINSIGGGGFTPQLYYSLAAATTVIGTTFQTIDWDTATFADTGYSESAGVITIGSELNGKRAKISASVMWSGATSRISVDMHLDIDPDGVSGYSTVKVSNGYESRSSTHDEGTQKIEHYVTLATGMLIRVQVDKIQDGAQTISQVINGTSISIETKS